MTLLKINKLHRHILFIKIIELPFWHLYRYNSYTAKQVVPLKFPSSEQKDILTQ